MKKIYKERFLKLYNHMLQPQEKLGHEKFDFRQFNDALSMCGTAGCMCGTAGCMGGELPIVFPDHWVFYKQTLVRLRRRKNIYTNEDFASFFNITISESVHLFYPKGQSKSIDPYFLNHNELSVDATKEEVVENLRRFLVIKNVL